MLLSTNVKKKVASLKLDVYWYTQTPIHDAHNLKIPDLLLTPHPLNRLDNCLKTHYIIDLPLDDLPHSISSKKGGRGLQIFYSDEDEGYIADIPDLGHCSAFGETPKEALSEVLKAKDAWLESARANGKPIPEPHYRPVIYQVA
jgi:predicted RNase H-like HicB family nuclease